MGWRRQYPSSPDKVPEFMAYQALIVKCSRDYEGVGWALYDRAFRRQVAVKARRSKICAVCLSDYHATEQCTEVWQGMAYLASFPVSTPSFFSHVVKKAGGSLVKFVT